MLANEYVQAVVLGIIQGIAEFLPISSSGHLVVVSEVLRQWTGKEFDAKSSLQMNVALHLGTLLSILVVYRDDLLRVARNLRMCVLLGAATVPLVVVGVAAHDFVEKSLQTSYVAGFGFLITAGLLWVAQRREQGTVTVESLSWRTAGVVGLFQAVAIVPGISRSGSTISAGVLVGLRRDDSCRFSFLIAVPAIAGAGIWMAAGIFRGEGSAVSWPALLIGACVAFVVGLFSLRWLILLVARQKLHWFAWYCVLAGLLTILWQTVTLTGD